MISISIMDYTLFCDHKRFFKAYIPRDDEGYQFTDKIQFYVRDLTAIDDADDAQKNVVLLTGLRLLEQNHGRKLTKLTILA